MAVSRIVVDANILVYANWSGAARHVEARSRLASLTASGDELCVTQQILREFLVVVTRPQGDVVPMSVAEAVDAAKAFMKLFDVLPETPRVAGRLLELVERFGVKGRVIHDANIVATMLDSSVTRLLTANPADFRRFADIIDIEPL